MSHDVQRERAADAVRGMSHGGRARQADTQREREAGGCKMVVSLYEVADSPASFSATSPLSGGSRTTLTPTGGKEHSSLQDAGCCVSSVNLLESRVDITELIFLWGKKRAGLTKTKDSNSPDLFFLSFSCHRESDYHFQDTAVHSSWRSNRLRTSSNKHFELKQMDSGVNPRNWTFES